MTATPKNSRPADAGWTEVDASRIPTEIAATYRTRGHTIAKAAIKFTGRTLRRCLWRVTSETGNTVEWIPDPQAQTAWRHKLVK